MDTQNDSLDFSQLKAMALGHQKISVPQVMLSVKTQHREGGPATTSSISNAGQAKAANNAPPSTSIARSATSPLLTDDNFPETETQRSWINGNGRVDLQLDLLSQPELPSTVPDSQPLKKMSDPGSLPGGDTQPVSPSLHESILSKSKTVQNAQEAPQPERATNLETQMSLHEGDVGFVDVLSMLEDLEEQQDGKQEGQQVAQPDRGQSRGQDAEQHDTNSESSEPAQQWNPALISPTQISVDSPEVLRFVRPKTPATHGRKRDYRGQTVDHSTPINPLAGIGTPAGAMGLSQVFNATQNPSSPLPDNLTSDPISNRPSPNFQTYGRPSTIGSLSSPIKLPSSALRPFPEPHTTYKSMKVSQAEREKRLKERKRFAEDYHDGDTSDSSDSVFGPEDSLVLRQQRKRRRQDAGRGQRSSPIRPGSSGRIGKRNARSSSPRLPTNKDIGSSKNAIVVPDDDLSMELQDLHPSSEDETDREEDLDEIGGHQVSKVASSGEEKENLDSSVIQVPNTTARLPMALEDGLPSDLSPSLRGNKLRSGAVRVDGDPDILHSPQQLIANATGFPSSPSVIVPNSQPSQPACSHRDKSENLPRNLDRNNDAQLSKSSEDLEIQSSANRVSFVPASSPQRLIDAPSSAIKPSGQENDCAEIRATGITEMNKPNFPSSPKIGTSEGDPRDELGTAGTEDAEQKHSEKSHSDVTESAKPERQPGFGSSRMPVAKGLTDDSAQYPDQNGGEVISETTTSADEPKSGEGVSNGLMKILPYPMPPPSLPPLRHDASTSSSHYDTARTQATGESHAQPAPSEQVSQPPSILASPSGKRRRALTEIAADLTPSNSFGEEDFDIGELMNVDEEFRAAVGTTPLKSPLQNRRRGKGGGAIGPVQSRTADIHPRESSPLSPPPAPPPHEQFNGAEDAHVIPAENKEAAAEEESLTQLHRSSQQPETVWDVSGASPQKVLKYAKKFQGLKKSASKLVSKMRSAPSAVIPEGRNAEGRTTVTSRSTPDPLQVDPSESSELGDASEAAQTSDADQIAPNMVFALFNGRTRAYYPAACLGLVAADQTRFRIKFEDTDLAEMDSPSVRRLELRIGDTVKVNLNGVPKIPHVVRGFKGKSTTTPSLAAQSQQPKVTDVFGHTALVVAAKQRKSLPGEPSTAAEVTREVPVSSIYLDNIMWKQVKERKYTFVAPGDTTTSAMEPPSAPVSTPSTPSSRRGRTSLLGLDPAPMTGLFSGMVFGVSYGQQEDQKSHLTKLIISNGGTIVPEGFNELFESPHLGPVTPTKRASKDKSTDNLDDSTASSFKVSPSAESLGFAALIADKHSRREKYLQALALNIPCLSGRWIEDCVTQSRILPWDPYLLPAGESKYLHGAVRSRTMAAYSPSTSRFADTVANRPKLLEGQSVLITMGKGRAEEKRKPYVFLTYALGAENVCRVPDLKAARGKMGDGEEWDWLYVDDHEEGGARNMLGSDKPATSTSTGKKRKRGVEDRAEGDGGKKRARVMVNEDVVQSLILGRVYEA